MRHLLPPLAAAPRPWMLVRHLLSQDPSSSAGDESLPLSHREVQVLMGMSRGLTNGQIAAALFLSEETVKTLAQRLYRKIGAPDRAAAVAWGIRGHLIP